MTSIIIAAHNEESVLGATLDDLLAGTDAQVIVVANGCRDATAEVAKARTGVVVVDLAEGGKANAVNQGELAATSFPRIYLDADISVPVGTVEALVSALSSSDGALVAVPGRELFVAGRPWPVRAWAAIHGRLPVFRNGLFGRGMIALSEEGRARFDTFPLMVADDLFLDAQFSLDERAHVDEYRVRVDTPATTRELLNRLTRVRRGSTAMRRAADAGEVNATVRQPDRWSWLRDVVAREPWLLPAGLVYVALTLIAAFRARRGSLNALDWGRDARGAAR